MEFFQQKNLQIHNKISEFFSISSANPKNKFNCTGIFKNLQCLFMVTFYVLNSNFFYTQLVSSFLSSKGLLLLFFFFIFLSNILIFFSSLFLLFIFFFFRKILISFVCFLFNLFFLLLMMVSCQFYKYIYKKLTKKFFCKVQNKL